MEKKNQTLREKIELSLRKVCGRVSPDRRAAVIIAMLIAFAVLNIWITVRAIWSIGRDDTPKQQIEIPLKENNERQLLNPENNDTTTIEQDQE